MGVLEEPIWWLLTSPRTAHSTMRKISFQFSWPLQGRIHTWRRGQDFFHYFGAITLVGMRPHTPCCHSSSEGMLPPQVLSQVLLRFTYTQTHRVTHSHTHTFSSLSLLPTVWVWETPLLRWWGVNSAPVSPPLLLPNPCLYSKYIKCPQVGHTNLTAYNSWQGM